MPIGLKLRAVFNSPSADSSELIVKIEQWLQKQSSALEPEMTRGRIDKAPALFCQLHPAANPLQIVLRDAEHLEASATTSSAGPGYHIYLARLLKNLAHEFGATWQPPTEDEALGDDTGYFFSGNEEAVQSSMATWLSQVAKLFFDGSLSPDDKGIAVGMPRGAHFESDQPAVTPLGPRDRNWLRRTAEDGMQGRDFFAWWEPALDANYYRGRALALMWTTVRWRPPVNDDEISTLKRVSTSLAEAYKLNPSLALPWAEWKEIIGWLEAAAPEEDLVLTRATSVPTIGYRRGMVTVSLTGGWRIRVHGSFSDFDFNQNHDLYAIDPPREIWFTSFGLPTPLTDEQFESAKTELHKAKHDHFLDGHQYVAAATIATKERQTGETYLVMNTMNISPAAKSVCSFVYPTAADEAWAMETWRSLRPPTPKEK